MILITILILIIIIVHTAMINIDTEEHYTSDEVKLLSNPINIPDNVQINYSPLNAPTTIYPDLFVDKQNNRGDKYFVITNNDGKTQLVVEKNNIDVSNSTIEKITYPDADDVVRYQNNGCYVKMNPDFPGPIKNLTKKKKIKCKSKSCDHMPLRKREANDIPMDMYTADGNLVYGKMTISLLPTFLGNEPDRYTSNSISTTYEYPVSPIDWIGSIPVNQYKGNPVPNGSSIPNINWGE
jgi:hypothetical protein